ncbi:MULTISPECIES: UDP-3-O-acyl-N-acetylglucosamine deacetylase [unclassified Paracoccus (in: a-proteobacteria)]|uniref:UDP-3-O-acyl-N-acetylglucosamine deacetylase n=1 Tax=unclassified Paracoccus (in: a-proteobacteria) TaxID=2688777 RepID=UPI0012B19DB3|nr:MULTISPECIES: UDP-3-O-acyl-N-acetylglucosamine deacetylase [unclassified Paracoccus (in: a-proteobacteria)]UXU74892.1 UDP-3-O-acyl-N-acetylglucosamine deacetylase [Paracoccus sp. SMMA_5]UXU80793.1 UDP-3-O-acyl-N-acetylglucosamine deacetylase [Paracoccus sp. SMMA_5_TC]
MQTTIAQKAQFRGVGLHSGAAVRLAILPAPADHGIVFVRTDLGGARIPALWDRVTPSQLCTLLDNGQGATVSTVEHVMAALAGTGIHNAIVEVNGPEVPILDGSAAPFVQGILQAGLRRYSQAPLRAIRVLREVEVQNGEAFARLSPADHLEIHFDISFADAAIGHQEKYLDMANGSFVHELMDSRTFCRQADVVHMQQNGLALGGTYLNAVVVDGDKVLSPGGLRHRDEAVRHKMLDAVGDLALAGAPLLARYTGHRAGHALTNKLLRALFSQPDAWEWQTLTPAMERALPGAGVFSDPALRGQQRQLAVA